MVTLENFLNGLQKGALGQFVRPDCPAQSRIHPLQNPQIHLLICATCSFMVSI